MRRRVQSGAQQFHDRLPCLATMPQSTQPKAGPNFWKFAVTLKKGGCCRLTPARRSPVDKATGLPKIVWGAAVDCLDVGTGRQFLVRASPSASRGTSGGAMDGTNTLFFSNQKCFRTENGFQSENFGCMPGKPEIR